MYEIMWDVNKFADKSLWPTDGSDPFVYSMNIGGSAAHGDYVFGWEGDSLQKAMDNNCNLNTACPKAGLTVQQPAQYNACKKKQQAPEEVNGCKLFRPHTNLRIHMLTYHSQGSRRCLLATRPSRHRRPHLILAFKTALLLPLLRRKESVSVWNYYLVLFARCLALIYLSSVCNNSTKIATIIYANCFFATSLLHVPPPWRYDVLCLSLLW